MAAARLARRDQRVPLARQDRPARQGLARRAQLDQPGLLGQLVLQVQRALEPLALQGQLGLQVLQAPVAQRVLRGRERQGLLGPRAQQDLLGQQARRDQPGQEQLGLQVLLAQRA